MKDYLLSTLDPDGKLRAESDDLIDGIAALRRKPDAVAILDESQSKAAGLPEGKHILFVEVEHSAPVTISALNEYADLYDFSCGTDLPHVVALAIVDRYGNARFVDLGGMFVAMISLGSGGIGDADAIRPHVVRAQAGV